MEIPTVHHSGPWTKPCYQNVEEHSIGGGAKHRLHLTPGSGLFSLRNRFFKSGVALSLGRWIKVPTNTDNLLPATSIEICTMSGYGRYTVTYRNRGVVLSRGKLPQCWAKILKFCQNVPFRPKWVQTYVLNRFEKNPLRYGRSKFCSWQKSHFEIDFRVLSRCR